MMIRRCAEVNLDAEYSSRIDCSSYVDDYNNVEDCSSVDVSVGSN